MTTAYDIGHIPERTIGRRLRDAREDTGMSQSEFAEATGMSRRTITRMEQATDITGLRKPALMAWAMATGVPLSWLQTGLVPASGDDDRGLDRGNRSSTGIGTHAPFLRELRPTG
jgi:transcriptional regulator with XRE-family HTH domain